MDREALERLSHEELLELLTQQAEVIGRQQQELAEREAAIERRDEKTAGLEEELAQFRRPVKTPENSSVPPSRGPEGQSGRGGVRRKLGPKRGHVGISRVRERAWDVVVECRPTRVRRRAARKLPQSGGRRDGAESGDRGAGRSRRW